MATRVLKTFVYNHKRYDVIFGRRFDTRDEAAKVQKRYYGGVDTAIYHDKVSGKWLLGTKLPLGVGFRGR